MHVEVIGDATLYLGDCARVLDELAPECVVCTDPPYGIGYAINARSWNNEGLDALKPFKMEKRAPIHGDDAPFDPAPLLRFARVAICGANHMAGLPAGKNKWIIWDKRRDSKPDDHSDCELIWTSVQGASRIHRQKWRGIIREGEENLTNSRKLHPNQKPVALLNFVLNELGATAGDTIVDPYMGSGSTGVVALRRGCKFVGVEIDRDHYWTACRRVGETQQMTMGGV